MKMSNIAFGLGLASVAISTINIGVLVYERFVMGHEVNKMTICIPSLLFVTTLLGFVIVMKDRKINNSHRQN